MKSCKGYLYEIKLSIGRRPSQSIKGGRCDNRQVVAVGQRVNNTFRDCNSKHLSSDQLRSAQLSDGKNDEMHSSCYHSHTSSSFMDPDDCFIWPAN